MKISFCTSCMGRLHHLKETLPANLRDAPASTDIEFVLLDYNSGDGLEAWIRETRIDEIRSGRVVYYQEREAKFFRPSHARNVSVGLSEGDVVCNLDADNFIGPEFVQKLMSSFSGGNRVVVGFDESVGGIAGRIALRRTDFDRLRGYDESLVNYGGEDDDLRMRATASGLPLILGHSPESRAIPHSHEERMKNMPMPEVNPGHSAVRNLARARSRPPGSIINPDGWGRATVFKNFDPRKSVV